MESFTNKQLTIIQFSEADEALGQVNGVARHLALITSELERRGHCVHTVIPATGGPSNHMPRVHRVPSWWLPGGTGYRLSLPLTSSVEEKVWQGDIYHSHHPFGLGVLGQQLARQANQPFLLTNHTQYEQYLHYVPVFGGLLRWPMRRYLRSFANRCDVVIAPAHETAERLQGSGITSRIRVVPNGIDIGRFATGDRTKWRLRLGIPLEAVCLLYVGRLGAEKRVEFLLRAYAHLPAILPHLILAGDGQSRRQLERLATDYNVQDRVHFVGNVAYEDMPDVYAMADIFVTASESEVHPLVLLEAQAAGLPAVVVKAPGTAEIVRDGVTGVVTKSTEADFTAGMQRMIGNSALRMQCRTAAQAYAKQFSIERCVDQLLETYQLALELKRANR